MSSTHSRVFILPLRDYLNFEPLLSTKLSTSLTRFSVCPGISEILQIWQFRKARLLKSQISRKLSDLKIKYKIFHISKSLKIPDCSDLKLSPVPISFRIKRNFFIKDLHRKILTYIIVCVPRIRLIIKSRDYKFSIILHSTRESFTTIHFISFYCLILFNLFFYCLTFWRSFNSLIFISITFCTTSRFNRFNQVFSPLAPLSRGLFRAFENLSHNYQWQ